MTTDVTTHAKQDFQFHLHLTIGEVAVLLGLFAYGHEVVLKDALSHGSAIKEGVGDAELVMRTLGGKIRGPLTAEYHRCMQLRRVFHNPERFVMSEKPREGT